VLFAGVTCGGAGDASAADSLTRCVEVLQQAAKASGGRVVKARGAEVMVLFPTPDAAARAAARMHLYVESLPEAAHSLGVRIAFHCGPVAQSSADDVFGDTVNLAAQLAEKAAKGQIVTSEATASKLSPHIRKSMLPLSAAQIAATQERLALGELVWRQGPSTIAFPMGEAQPAARFLLTYGTRKIERRREGDSALVGRDAVCDLVIPDTTASRRHCTVLRRSDRIVLRDHSTNGTFVTAEGEPEVRVHEAEIPLRRRGWISLGQARSRSLDVVQYLCE
jgi:adenylate cyclase